MFLFIKDHHDMVYSQNRYLRRCHWSWSSRWNWAATRLSWTTILFWWICIHIWRSVRTSYSVRISHHRNIWTSDLLISIPFRSETCKLRKIGTPISKLAVRPFRSDRYAYSGGNGTASSVWISFFKFPAKPSVAPFHILDRKLGSWVIVVKRPFYISATFQVKWVNRSTGTSAPFSGICIRIKMMDLEIWNKVLAQRNDYV